MYSAQSCSPKCKWRAVVLRRATIRPWVIRCWLSYGDVGLRCGRDFNIVRRQRGHLFAQLLEEDCGEVAFTVAGNDNNDELALVLRLLRLCHGRADGSAGRDADEETFFTREPERHLE